MQGCKRKQDRGSLALLLGKLLRGSLNEGPLCHPHLLMVRQNYGQADQEGLTCRHSDDRPLPIGFCFSFPCTHTAIGEAVMVKLTKKFENEGMVGQDPAKGLQRALDRQKGNVRSPPLQALLHGCLHLLLPKLAGWAPPLGAFASCRCPDEASLLLGSKTFCMIPTCLEAPAQRSLSQPQAA